MVFTKSEQMKATDMIPKDAYRELVGEKMIIEVETIFCDICEKDTDSEYPDTCNICGKECCHRCRDTVFAPRSNDIHDTGGTGVITICTQCRNDLPTKYSKLSSLINELSELEEKESTLR